MSYRFEYRGFRFDGSSRQSAPNFGGREYWWECWYTNGQRSVIGTGSTPEEAAERAYESIDYALDAKPFQLRQVDANSEIPF